MSGGDKARLVYSTAVGRVCPGCGWPVKNCKCSESVAPHTRVSGRGRIVAKLRMEKKGRAGKTATVVAGLPRDTKFLRELCQELKRACGTGGTISEDTIELQGDLRQRVREYLEQKNFVVKG